MGALRFIAPAGRTVYFQPNGTLSDGEAGTDKQGAWTTANAARENRIFYKLDPSVHPTDVPAGWDSVKVAWSFNAGNQLVAEVQGQTCVFDGLIKLADNLDLEYSVIGNGASGPHIDPIATIHVYGKPSFDASDDLVIHLNGGGQARIRGGDLDRPVGPANRKFFLRKVGSKTQLYFRAETRNSDNSLVGATIAPLGVVDIAKGQMVLNVKVSAQDCQLAFQGELHGTTVGLSYDSKSGFKLDLAGKWQFNNFTNTVSLKLTAVSSSQFSAQISGQMVGKQLAGAGTLTLSYVIAIGGDEGNRLQVTLDGRYEIDQRGFLYFKLELGTSSYRFEIGAEYRSADGRISCAFNSVVTPGGASFSAALDIDIDNFKLKVNTSLAPGSRLATEINFTIRQVFRASAWQLERVA